MNASGGVTDVQWIKSDMYENYERWICHKYYVNLHDHAKQYDNDECVMINGMVESCMAIYLGMAMEMP